MAIYFAPAPEKPSLPPPFCGRCLPFGLIRSTFAFLVAALSGTRWRAIALAGALFLGGTCNDNALAAASGSGTLDAAPSWNLLGNSFDTTLDVAAIFGNQDAPVAGVTAHVVSLWKWNAAAGRWAFYSPQLTAAGNASFAASRNFDLLSAIAPGEGYWLYALEALTIPVPSGAPFTWSALNFANLVPGFNLIATAQSMTPTQFNDQVNPTPPSPGIVPTGNFVSLWAWDTAFGKWFFHSPLLEAAGGLSAVKQYADNHGHLHFADHGRNLGTGVGFWVNVPTGGLAQYALSVTSAGGGTGYVNVNPSALTYASGAVVTLTATPNPGSTFSGWSGACSGIASTCTVTMDANKLVTATFDPISTHYVLSIANSGDGSGLVSVNPAGSQHAAGTNVTLVATPDPGSTFSGWLGACTGTAATCTVTMDGNRSAAVLFGIFGASDSLLDGAFDYAGPWPALNAVTYQAKDGITATIPDAYPGFVQILVDATTTASSLVAAIQGGNGVIKAQIPKTGFYLVKIAPGSENAFLGAMFAHSWVREGAPASLLYPGAISVFDFPGTPPFNDCQWDHGDLVQSVAARRGGSVTLTDVVALPNVSTIHTADPVDISRGFVAAMEQAHRAGRRTVFNFSLQGAELAGTVNRSGCHSTTVVPGSIPAGSSCHSARVKQKWFWHTWLGQLDAVALTRPAVMHNSLFVLIAGNSGLDLDTEVAALQSLYPNAFRHVVFVGGATASTSPVKNLVHNHLMHDVGNKMVYARSQNVQIPLSATGTCSGTSFAAPEIASVLDYIWSQVPSVSSELVLGALRQALEERGSPVVPQDANGFTTSDFINRVIELLRPTITVTKVGANPDHSPRNESKVTSTPNGIDCGGTCTGTFASGASVNLTVTAASGERFTHWSGACSGSGACTVLIDQAKTVTAHFEPLPSGNAIAFASADSRSCDYGSNADEATCVTNSNSDTSTSFQLSANRGTGGSQVSYGASGTFSISVSTTSGDPLPQPRADALGRLSNRFAVRSDSLAPGTPVNLTVQINLSALLMATADPDFCHSATAQLLLFVGLNFGLLNPGSAGAQVESGARVQRFDCFESTLHTLDSTTFNFGLSNGRPVLISAPQPVVHTIGGFTPLATMPTMTANIVVPVGEHFQIFIQAHGNASMRGGRAASSGAINLGPIQFGPLPAGVIVNRIPG